MVTTNIPTPLQMESPYHKEIFIKYKSAQAEIYNLQCKIKELEDNLQLENRKISTAEVKVAKSDATIRAQRTKINKLKQDLKAAQK